MAVDGDGRALTWNGSRWSAPAAIDPHGGGLTSVACVASWSCVATDARGGVVELERHPVVGVRLTRPAD